MTVGAAFDELSRHRWIALHKTGRTSREYIFDPARKLTEAQHASLTQHGVHGTMSAEGNGALDTKGMVSEAPRGLVSEAPTKKTITDKTKEKNGGTPPTSQDVKDGTVATSQDIQARKREIRPQIRELVASLLPGHEHRDHLTNVAVVVMAENEDITPYMVELALKRWTECETNPARLARFIKDELNGDLLVAIKKPEKLSTPNR